MPEGEHRLLFTEEQVRNAFVLSGVGMVGLLVLLLVLATSKPQGRPQVADDSQFRTTLLAAAENLDGYELIGEDRARIDVRHAMELVVERGTTIEIVPIGQATAPATSAMVEATADATADASSTVDGGIVYAANCAGCHQATGAGIPGVFPNLAGGHAATLAVTEGGRDYLVAALLYGVQGAIVVDGFTYNGMMPAWPQLSDADVAAVLQYVVTTWDDAGIVPSSFEPFTATEIEAARGRDLTASDVLSIRPTLP